MQNVRFQLMRTIDAKLCFHWCSKIHSKILNDKNIIAIFGVIVQNFGPVYILKIKSNFALFVTEYFYSCLDLIKMKHFICFPGLVLTQFVCQRFLQLIPLSSEPRQANLCLWAFRHDKFQLRMPSHSEGPGIWLSVSRFLLIHSLYERAAKVLARLRRCAGSPEPSLLA